MENIQVGNTVRWADHVVTLKFTRFNIINCTSFERMTEGGGDGKDNVAERWPLLLLETVFVVINLLAAW